MLVAGKGSSVKIVGMQKNLVYEIMMQATDLSTNSDTSVLNKVSVNKEPSCDSEPGADVNASTKVNKPYPLLPLKFQSTGN
jgi:hypothetical protein